MISCDFCPCISERRVEFFGGKNEDIKFDVNVCKKHLDGYSRDTEFDFKHAERLGELLKKAIEEKYP